MKEYESKNCRFSIAICTYNPDRRVLERCLSAVKKLVSDSPEAEVILVDNNSQSPIIAWDFVKSFVKDLQVSFHEEKQQGIAYARIAAIRAAKGDVLVFLDDDNEVSVDYLHELNDLLVKYPLVAAWGPGNVTVDFLDGTDEFIATDVAGMFQEKAIRDVEYAMIKRWQSCYPYGTGLCIRKDVAEFYVEQICREKYTLVGRAGGRMASGEDSELILSAIAKGYAAGHSPGLKINHMIPARKVTFEYLKRLAFGAASCYYQFHAEVFPEHMEWIKNEKVEFDYKEYYRKAYAFRRWSIKNKKLKILHMIEKLGTIYSLAVAKKQSVPSNLSRLLEKIGC